jgi:periplasmic divalent cation tolerance protein
MNTVAIVLTTLPDSSAASALAEKVLTARLAACATQLAPAQSSYHWQGKLEHNEEIPMLFKTAPAQVAALEKFIADQHPYQVPEIVSWIASAAAPYAQWVATETHKPTYV